ncbi:MAG: CPXCG motif-containing cysteine-rich protein [Acidobacteriota bacterium]
MSLLETVQIVCPYCGECMEVVVDCSIRFQEYTEDCQVCCQPMNLIVSVNQEGEPSIQVRHQND